METRRKRIKALEKRLAHFKVPMAKPAPVVNRYTRERRHKEKISRTRKHVQKAFRTLRRNYDLVVRSSFQCCMSCACAALEPMVVGKRGAVYYHQQDNDHFRKSGELDVRYFSTGGTDEDTKKIGEDVVAELMSQGLEVEWDGSPKHTIHVVGMLTAEIMEEGEEDAG